MENASHATPEELSEFAGKSALSSLGLVLLTDQISRNLNRGNDVVKVFKTYDPIALRLSKLAIKHEQDKEVKEFIKRSFFYLPLMHSEVLEDQKMCVQQFEIAMKECNTTNDEFLKFAKKHLENIDRFGRFPHRNKALGRVSTPEEIRFLEEGGGFG